MVEQITFQTVFQFLQTVSIMVGIIYYLMILNNQQKSQKLALVTQENALETRNTQFFLQMYSGLTNEKSLQIIWGEIFKEKTWTNFDEWWDVYGPDSNPEFYAYWFKTMLTYEMYGVLLKRGYLNVDVLDDIMSGAVLMIWDRYGDVIMGFREKYGYPQFQEHQEYLTNELKKTVSQQHPDFKGKTQL
ncbi:hypothetical protein JXL21_06730 [Candidatus Bathyarchaeota archaeon]|nr:hypothetical protein [Candidatus Bathyarchaeota archaeon]